MEQNHIDASLLAEFIDESTEGLRSLDALFVQLEKNPESSEIINAIFRPVHSLKGNSAFFGLMDVKRLAHRMENLLDLVRKGARKADRAVIDALLPGVDLLRRMLEEVRNHQESKDISTIVEAVLIPINAFVENQALAPISNAPQNIPTAEPTAIISNAPHDTLDKTMRVSEHSIDAFLEFVGELVILEETFGHLVHQLQSNSNNQDLVTRLCHASDSFTDLSGKLRDSILDIRRVPARQLLQKVPRLAREASLRMAKQVEIQLVGEDVRLDKSYVDLLDAPLTHLVNNAMDHGFEMPEQRVTSGKSVQGTLTVRIVETEANLVLEVQDDGRGIDAEAVFQKAVSLGLIAKDARLETQQKIELLFLPGLSTAAKVTETSGRGVGMDVVRRNIQEAGGAIQIKTTVDAGSLFIITLPRSIHTQIVDGFAVEVNQQLYLIPLGLVGESFREDTVQVTHLSNGSKMVVHHGKSLAFKQLADLLGTLRASQPGEGTIVVLNAGKSPTALLVDYVVGIQKVVVKNMHGINSDLFEGAALMGDGRLALILKVKAL